MKKDWLWDKKIPISKIRAILKDPNQDAFISTASLLLSRKNDPREVFTEYLKPILFCKYWPAIKKRMRSDDWNSQRIVFWQAIYEKVSEKYRGQGIKFRNKRQVINELCREVGGQLCQLRKSGGISQRALAKKLGVSQQLISRIEGGKENMSLLTLEKIATALNKKIDIKVNDYV